MSISINSWALSRKIFYAVVIVLTKAVAQLRPVCNSVYFEFIYGVYLHSRSGPVKIKTIAKAGNLGQGHRACVCSATRISLASRDGRQRKIGLSQKDENETGKVDIVSLGINKEKIKCRRLRGKGIPLFAPP